MSFSGTVKEELAAHISSARHCQLAELAAYILFNCGVCEDGRHLCLDTENEAVARKCFTLLKKTFNIESLAARRVFECGFHERSQKELPFGVCLR